MEQSNKVFQNAVKNRKRNKYVITHPYNGEDLAFELKYDIIGDHFDYIVIQEGVLTHTGLEKKLLFDYENFP